MKLSKGIRCDSWVAYVVLNTPDSKLYSVMGTLFSSTTTCTFQHTIHVTRFLEHSACDDGRTHHFLSRCQREAEGEPNAGASGDWVAHLKHNALAWRHTQHKVCRSVAPNTVTLPGVTSKSPPRNLSPSACQSPGSHSWQRQEASPRGVCGQRTTARTGCTSRPRTAGHWPWHSPVPASSLTEYHTV